MPIQRPARLKMSYLLRLKILQRDFEGVTDKAHVQVITHFYSSCDNEDNTFLVLERRIAAGAPHGFHRLGLDMCIGACEVAHIL